MVTPPGVGGRVREAREARGLDLDALATSAGLTVETLDAFEQGVVTFMPLMRDFVIAQVAVAVNLPVAFFHRPNTGSGETASAHGTSVDVCWMCGEVADYRCDHEDASGQSCDAALCQRCAVVTGDQHSCPGHYLVNPAPVLSALAHTHALKTALRQPLRRTQVDAPTEMTVTLAEWLVLGGLVKGIGVGFLVDRIGAERARALWDKLGLTSE